MVLLAKEMKKTKVKINKPIYQGLSILEISKTLMYVFWYDYIKGEYQNNAKLCYMNSDSFIIHIKTEDYYEDIVGDLDSIYDTSNYEVDRPFPKGMNKKVIGLIKHELGRNSKTEFFGRRPETYTYLTDDDKNIKKAKGQKSVVKRTLKFDGYHDCFHKNEIILKSQKRFKVKHIVYKLKKSIRFY